MPRHTPCDMARQNASQTISSLLGDRYREGRSHMGHRDHVAFAHIAQCQEGLCSSARAQLTHFIEIQPKGN